MPRWPGLLIFVATLLLSSHCQYVCSMSQASKVGKTGHHKLAVYWYRHNDLRLRDHPGLKRASAIADHCIPFFCFDEKIFGSDRKTPSGGLKCGPRRAKFIRESVKDLKENLRSTQSDLVVCHGDPAQEMRKLMEKLSKNNNISPTIVLCQEEVVKEEIEQVKSVQNMLTELKNCKLEQVWGSTMYELEDLPYADDLSDMPDVFTPFRNKVEKKCSIPSPLSIPRLVLPDNLKLPESNVPSLLELGYTAEQNAVAESYDDRSVLDFAGGESAALARLKDYIWTQDRLRVYFDTRNGMLGEAYSTKLSPWLAHGNISPRLVAAECRRHEQEREANKSTYWVVFELIWRDYCKFFAKKHGDRIFFLNGTAGKEQKWSISPKNLQAWQDGKTGYPLVDANMREMKASGFMSNRGRQNVASFLVFDLKLDWRSGGDYFESELIDYDVYSNWVNWCQAAGVTGGRLNRFNVPKQSKDYDQHGDYVRHWLPELKDVPTEFVHEPWKMTHFQQMEFKCKLGVDYPHPIAPPPKAHNNRGNGKPTKQRKPNKNNRHQAYEMKHVKRGEFRMENDNQSSK